MHVICQAGSALPSPGHSAKSGFWQPFSTLCSCGVGNDRCSRGLFLDCILSFGTSIFVFMPNLRRLNLLLIISFRLSAQLSKMFQLSLHRYSG